MSKQRKMSDFKPLWAGPNRSFRKLVLIVDGQPEIRELLTQYLIRRGLIAVPVPDGAQAEIMCETLKPDLILFDLMVPDIDSITLIGQLKAQRPGAPLVVILAPPNPDLEAQCRAAGANAVIPRPLDLKHLGQVLSRLLRLPATPRNGYPLPPMAG